MNKITKSLLTVGAACALAVTSFAAGNMISISVDPSVKILVNGAEFKPTDANGNDVMTFIYNGTTYAPLRALAEAYGLEVGYDAARNMATVSEPGKNYDTPAASSATPSAGTFFTESGTGDSVVRSVETTTPSRFLFRTSDKSHHSVKGFYGDGNYDYDLLVNESGAPYEGSSYLPQDRTYDFEINCSGAWEIEVQTIGYSDNVGFSGHGDTVTDIIQPSAKYYTITYTGTDHFSVKQRYGTGKYDYELLVNESGKPYTGTVRLKNSDKPCFFEISGTDGDWTITPAE